MTEQQAPTLAAVIGVDSLYMAPGLHPSDFPIGTKLYALAKNIDTASPSPASLQEQVLAAIKEEYCSEPQDDEDVAYDAGVGDALAAAMRAFRLATPQPSPTGPTTEQFEQEIRYQAGDIERAKRLIVTLHERFPEARELIEEKTGPWMVWGVDRFGIEPTGPREGEPA